MNKNRIIWTIVAVLAAVGIIWLIAAKNGAGPAVTPKTPVIPTPSAALSGEVTIGAVLSTIETGHAKTMKKAMEFAAEQINAGAGVGGKKLVIAFEDATCDAAAAGAAADTLIEAGVKLILSGGECEETSGMLPLVNNKKIVVISPASHAAELAVPNDFLFRLAPSDARVGAAAASYARNELKAARAAVLSETGNGTQPVRKAFTEGFKKGGAIILDETFAPGATDFAAWVKKVKNGRIDVVYVVASGDASGVAAVKALRDTGITAKVLATRPLLNEQVVAGNAATLEGVVSFDAAPFNAQGARAADFAAAYTARYLEDAGDLFPAAGAHGAVYLAKDLFEAGKGDGATMQKMLSSLSGWAGGALSDLTLDKNGDSAWKDYAVLEAADGRVSQIKSISVK